MTFIRAQMWPHFKIHGEEKSSPKTHKFWFNIHQQSAWIWYEIIVYPISSSASQIFITFFFFTLFFMGEILLRLHFHRTAESRSASCDLMMKNILYLPSQKFKIFQILRNMYLRLFLSDDVFCFFNKIRHAISRTFLNNSQFLFRKNHLTCGFYFSLWLRFIERSRLCEMINLLNDFFCSLLTSQLISSANCKLFHFISENWIRIEMSNLCLARTTKSRMFRSWE